MYACIYNLLSPFSFAFLYAQDWWLGTGKLLWETAPKTNWLFLSQQLLSYCNSSSRGKTLWNFPHFAMWTCVVMLILFRPPYCWKFMGMYFLLGLGGRCSEPLITSVKTNFNWDPIQGYKWLACQPKNFGGAHNSTYHCLKFYVCDSSPDRVQR